MRKRLIPIAIAATVAAGLAAVPLTASAGDDSRVTIGVRLDFTSSTEATGTFAACCAIDDAGTAKAKILSFTPRGSRAQFEATNTFEGAKGSFTILLQGSTGPLDRRRHVAHARWRAIDGSGAYEDIRAHGRLTAVTDQDTGALTAIDVGQARGVEDD